jgi:hypothetical protein
MWLEVPCSVRAEMQQFSTFNFSSSTLGINADSWASYQIWFCGTGVCILKTPWVGLREVSRPDLVKFHRVLKHPSSMEFLTPLYTHLELWTRDWNKEVQKEERQTNSGFVVNPSGISKPHLDECQDGSVRLWFPLVVTWGNHQHRPLEPPVLVYLK